MTTHTTTNAPETHPAVLSTVAEATRSDGRASTAIFYGAAHYSHELARQRDLVSDYAEAVGLDLFTEFHDRQGRHYGLSLLLAACQRGGVDYVVTAAWPTPNLTAVEAETVLEQLAEAGTHLVCLQAWRPGEGELPDWWDSATGRQIRQLDELREHDRQQREQASQPSNVNDDNEDGDVSAVNERSGANEGNRIGETSGIAAGTGSLHELTQTSQINETTDLSKEVRHA